MGRTSTATGTTDATPEPREPEIMRSAMLANIITLELVEMVREADTRYEAAHMGRTMTATLAAVRGLVSDVRAFHRLPAINWATGLPFGDTDVSTNGAAPAEAAEATS
jgi:hypothetical protein